MSQVLAALVAVALTAAATLVVMLIRPGWNEIRITGHEHDQIHESLECERRNVQADPHVDALLNYLRDEVGRLDR